MNLTQTNQAFTKNIHGSLAEAEREQHLRSLYLQLTKEVILNNIYEPGPHIDEGRQWPPHKALTMIGRKRLDNVQELVEQVLNQSIPGDLIETGVWRGGRQFSSVPSLKLMTCTIEKFSWLILFGEYHQSILKNIPRIAHTKEWRFLLT